MNTAEARIGVVLFFSGLFSLVYQVAWLRLLRLVFGVSTASTAVVLAIFMGGLGLGGIILGRRAQAARNPLALYAWLEAGIGLAAAASPLLIDLVRYLYVALGGVSTMGMGVATVLRILLAVAVLGLPTTLMGGTLPAVAQALERDADRGRRVVAWFYGINTLGAVVGAALTTFLLLEIFGVRHSLWLVAALNLLLAVVVRRMARKPEFARQEPPGAEARPAEADAAEAPPAITAGGLDASPAGARLVLVAAGIVGFIFFLMELVWYRMLAPVLGGSSYTFGLILAVALAGIGAGGLLFALGSRARRPTLAALATTCVLEGLAVALPYAAGDDLALLAAILRQLGVLGFDGLIVGWAAVASLVVLPAAIISGYQFPLLVALLGSGPRRVGSQVGLAYAWNTWGAIIGSLAGGFGLLPLLTAPRLWRLSVLLLTLVGAAIAGFAWRRRRRWTTLAVPLACGALSLALCLAPGPSAFWRHLPIGAGRLATAFAGPNELRAKLNEARRQVVVEAEGIESSIALARQNELSLFVNGKSDGSLRGDGPTAVMSGLIGALLHPEPRRVLVIGLGTGTTAGWLSQVATVEQVDVIELEPAVVEFAHLFDPATFRVLDQPNVRLFYGDGREYVLTAPATYDLIFSEPSNPYRAGVADLFSQDFYFAVRERLRPGGIFMQWLQGYEVDANVVRTAFATLGSVFPQVESWQVHGTDLMLLATAEPVSHDVDRLRARLGQEPFRTGMRVTWQVDGVEGLYSGFLGTQGLTAALAAAAEEVTTDDRPVIEFGFARNVGRKGLFRVAELRHLARRLAADRPSVAGFVDWALVRELRQVRRAAGAMRELPPPGELTPAERARWAAREAYRDGNLAAAARHWRSQDREPLSPLDRLLVAEVLADRGDPEVARYLEPLRSEAPTEAELIAAHLSWRQNDLAAATDHLVRGLEMLRHDVWVFQPVVLRGFNLVPELAADRELGRQLLAAVSEPFAAMLFEEIRLAVYVNLAGHVDMAGQCVNAFAALEPHVIWEENFLNARVACYEQTQHPLAARARADLAEFLAHAPVRL